MHTQMAWHLRRPPLTPSPAPHPAYPDDLAPETPPQDFEFPSLCYVCGEDFMLAVLQQLEDEDVARLSRHAEAVAAYQVWVGGWVGGG